MEPGIQYARTASGVQLACYASGEGRVVVFLPFLPVSHVEAERQVSLFRDCFDWFAGHRRFVRYDARRTGLSTRDVEDMSLDAHVADLEAVLDRLGVDRCDVFGASFSGPIAIAFAARQPERVEHLVLWCTHAKHSDVWDGSSPASRDQRRAMQRLGDADLDLFLRTWLHRAAGWAHGRLGEQLFQLTRASIEPTTFFAALEAYMAFDATEDLPAVQAPTLVLHRRDFAGSAVSVARGLAARIPNARLVVFEGESVLPFVDKPAEIFETIDDFLGAPLHRAPYPSGARPSAGPGLRTILFTDIEGDISLTRRLGDERARAILRDYERLTAVALEEYGGTEVKTMPEGVMASFASAQQALDCAAAIQARVHALADEPGEHPRVRIGVNAGEPIAEDGDLFGTAVIAASRLAHLADGGEVLVANVVRELVAGKSFRFQDRGEMPLRGFEEPARVYELLLRS